MGSEWLVEHAECAGDEGSSNTQLDLELTLRPPGVIRNYDASSRKRMNTSWSDLNHDVLYSVMMQLGVVDFVSFSGVCNSWRSLALCNRKTFMVSQPPMLMYESCKTTCDLYLQDFEGRKFRTLIPQLVGRECVGSSCGYLILFGQETRDFWLVNPITRHELHFPGVTFDLIVETVRGILVFSPSVNGWVFLVTNKIKDRVWFSIAGKGAWNHAFSRELFLDLHAFNGKIYILNYSKRYPLCEMRLDPVPKITVINTGFLDSVSCLFSFVSSDENLYLLNPLSRDMYKVHTLGFDHLNWVPCEKTRQEYAVFHSAIKFNAVVKPESWASKSSHYPRFFDTRKRVKDRYYVSKWWYFPHDCLNIDLIDE